MTYEEMLAEAASRGLVPAGTSALTGTGEVVYGAELGNGDSGPASPYGFYGGEGIGADGAALVIAADGVEGGATFAQAIPPGAIGTFVLTGAVALRALGAPMVRRIVAWMASMGIRRGARFPFARLPNWMRTALLVFGVSAGYDVVFDLEDVGEGVLPALPDGGFPAIGAQGPGVTIIGVWVANGRRFYRLSDGRLATQKNDGRWTIWRPKRPIVLMPTGAADLDVLLRADRVVDRQTARLAKMMRRRGYEVRKKTAPKPC